MTVCERDAGRAATVRERTIRGRQAVRVALESDRAVHRVCISRDARGADIRRLKALASQADVPFQFVPVAKLNQLAVGLPTAAFVFVTLSPSRKLVEDKTNLKNIMGIKRFLHGSSNNKNSLYK